VGIICISIEKEVPTAYGSNSKTIKEDLVDNVQCGEKKAMKKQTTLRYFSWRLSLRMKTCLKLTTPASKLFFKLVSPIDPQQTRKLKN